MLQFTSLVLLSVRAKVEAAAASIDFLFVVPVHSLYSHMYVAFVFFQVYLGNSAVTKVNVFLTWTRDGPMMIL